MSPFFGKTYWVILSSLAVVFFLSVLVFETPWAAVLLVAVMAGVFALTFYRLEYGLVAAFAELFANSHGHLIDGDVGMTLSLRMGVFIAVMAGYAIRLLMRRSSVPSREAVRLLLPFFALFFVAIYGFVRGFEGHPIADVFADGNAYFYLWYLLPIASVSWNGERRGLLLKTLMAGATWASLLTIGLLFIFTHLPQEILSATYTFIRDTRTGELTRFDNGLFRIFLQAQFSAVIAWLLLCVYRLLAKERFNRGEMGGQILFLSALVMGLSRSFWVGIVAGLFFIVAVIFKKNYLSIGDAWRRFMLQGAWLGGAISLLFIVILFPFPQSTTSWNALGNLLSSRATETDDVAVSSRWNLLPPLLEEIKEAPIFGKGFGEEVQFVTDDPRARTISPDGTWTTYAFEWGWLEIWLKMGIFGLAAFAWVFVSSVRGLLPHLRDHERWIGVGGIGILLIVFITHFFSPYLNHPLGLGLLLFLLPFWKTQKSAVSKVEPEPVKPVATQPSVAPFMSE